MATAHGSKYLPTATSCAQGTDDPAEKKEEAVQFYDSQKELLQSLSQLRDSIHCDKQLAERDSFLKKASHQVSQCKNLLREKWTVFLGSTMLQSVKKSMFN